MSNILQLLGDFGTQAPTGNMPPDLTGDFCPPLLPRSSTFDPQQKFITSNTGAPSIFRSLRLRSSWSVGVERRMLRSWI